MVFTNYVIEKSFDDKLKDIEKLNNNLKGLGDEFSEELKKSRKISNEIDKELDDFYNELKKIYPAME